MRNAETSARLFHSRVPGMRGKQGVRARTSQPASPATRPGKGQTHGTPLTCPSAPLFIPGTCPHPCPSRLRSRKVLHFQEGPSLQSGAGQGSLIKQPLKQASLCPICLAEQRRLLELIQHPGNNPDLYPPLQGISSPQFKYKQTDCTKCPSSDGMHPAHRSPMSPQFWAKGSTNATTGGCGPAVLSHHHTSAPCPLLLHPERCLAIQHPPCFNLASAAGEHLLSSGAH